MPKLRADYVVDRRPTEQDADDDLDVVELLDEETGDWRYATWDEVWTTRAWRHTDWWRPQ